jgi:4-aminobutyrate aminotransferase-like enzyme
MKRGTDDTLQLLQRYESRNIAFVDPAGDWPIVWQQAKGVHVWDTDGKKYLDLTAAFGVAAAGHSNRRVVAAGQRQMATLMHAMGDVHPHPLKAQLARELSQITFGRWLRQDGKTIFCNSGFEAVEAALKTAHLATGRPGIVAFEGAYHGLGYGTLNATHRDLFRKPFAKQLGEFGRWVGYPVTSPESRETKTRILAALETGGIGAILLEPIQGRGGIKVPHPSFLPWLRLTCDRHGVLLILDEIYTGFGRTGKWFGSEHWGVFPDLVCVGKALTGGFPLSACIGRADLMDAAWPESDGEAIHTSTFLGHPVGCAMALANIEQIRKLKLPQSAARMEKLLLKELTAMTAPDGYHLAARGKGLFAGLEITLTDGRPATGECVGIMKGMLRRGFILLPEGDAGNVISIIPPLTITDRQLQNACRALQSEINGLPK